MDDVAVRLANRVQLTSDDHKAYPEAVEGAFGAGIDYAMRSKIYGASSDNAKDRYSPADCIGIKERIESNPNMKHVSTSYSERANFTVRMHNRRFPHLTNAFSKKFENHAHMVVIYAVWHNFIRVHTTRRVTPAIASDLSETVMDWSDIVEAMDADAPAKKRVPYKKSPDLIRQTDSVVSEESNSMVSSRPARIRRIRQHSAITRVGSRMRTDGRA